MSLDVAELCTTHYALIRAYVRQRLEGVGDAAIDDLVADVFERAVRGAPRYRDRGVPPKTWLFQIAKNLLTDQYRRRSLIEFVSLGDIRPYVEYVGTDTHADQIDVAHALATYQTGNASYPPDKHLAIIRARFWEGQTEAAIAHHLGVTHAAVKKLRERAVKNLRKALEAAA